MGLAVASGAGSAASPPKPWKVNVEGRWIAAGAWVWLDALMAPNATFVGSGRLWGCSAVNGTEVYGSADGLGERASDVVSSA